MLRQASLVTHADPVTHRHVIFVSRSDKNIDWLNIGKYFTDYDIAFCKNQFYWKSGTLLI